jgi:hypothetical protein
MSNFWKIKKKNEKNKYYLKKKYKYLFIKIIYNYLREKIYILKKELCFKIIIKILGEILILIWSSLFKNFK